MENGIYHSFISLKTKQLVSYGSVFFRFFATHHHCVLCSSVLLRILGPRIVSWTPCLCIIIKSFFLSFKAKIYFYQCVFLLLVHEFALLKQNLCVIILLLFVSVFWKTSFHSSLIIKSCFAHIDILVVVREK